LQLDKPRQHCPDCDWAGLTLGRKAMLAMWCSYLFVAVVVLLLMTLFPERAGFLNYLGDRRVQWSVGGFFVAMNIAPFLFNRCPQCGGKRIIEGGSQ
jgi:hypothetical protein